MPVAIKVPSVGEPISEGIISRWLKKDGDTVQVEEPLFELETDKATTEVAAPAAGTLRITSPEGSTVAIGPRTGAYTPPPRTLTVELPGLPAQSFADDGSARTLTF